VLPETVQVEGVPGQRPAAPGAAMDWERLTRGIGELASLATREFEVDELLHRLCDIAARALDVDGAGVMAGDARGTRFVHASTRQTVELERLQETLQDGPCRDALRTGQDVFIGDYTQMRWPAFEALSRSAGLPAVLAIPLHSRGKDWGTLDLYWSSPRELSENGLAAARMLADVAVSYLVMAADRSEALAAREHLARRALHDELTGLPNRGLLQELLYHALAASQRRGGLVAVLFVDLDRFKAVNDTFGHRVGDAVLVAVADRLRTAVRGSDVVGRLSGDEFLVLCEHLDPAREVDDYLLGLGERIRTALAAPIVVDGRQCAISASIGIAVTSGHVSAADLMHAADAAMYAAKFQGRDRVVVSMLDAAGIDRHMLERQLFGVVERGELELHYQPIVAPDGRLQAAEALVRWRHPDLGLLPAADFVELAEATGAIVAMGHWVIGRAAADLADWRRRFANLAPRKIFVNLCPLELVSSDLPAVLDAALAGNGLQPSDLTIELLESTMSDGRLLPAIIGLGERGHPLAIDDFGTGYSSLHRLVELPVTYLKVDRSVISGLPDDQRSISLIRAVTTIADSLGLTVICEGVETRDQILPIEKSGVPLLQGYCFGHPMPAEQLTATIAADRTVTGPIPVIPGPRPAGPATPPGL
jgi:diguanylate cyclase (GGDEF)-like protein